MTRRGAAFIVTILVAASVVASAAGASTRGQHRHEGETHQFVIKFSPFFLLDLGRPGISQGDQITANDRLLNRNGKSVGHDGLACTITDPSHAEAACQGTFVLPGGQITVQFLNSPPPVKIGAITGGTGRFRAAEGQMRLVEPATGNVGTVTFSIDN